MSNPKNRMYWSCNLPLQVWPVHEDPDNDESPIVDARVLNYMPRKECVTWINLSELLEEQTREEFFMTAASILENLARQFRVAAVDQGMDVYYPDEGMPPATSSPPSKAEGE